MKWIAIVIVVALLIGGAWWLGSRSTASPAGPAAPPPSSSIESWTPEKIVAQPEAYLDVCEAKVKDALGRLRTRADAIVTARASFQRNRDEAATTVTTIEPIYQDLKTATDKATAWPVTWAGEPRTADWAKGNLADLDSQLAVRRKLLGTYDTAIDRLNRLEGDNRNQQNFAHQQLAEIKTSREFVRIDKMSDDVQKRLLEMRSMVQNVLANTDKSSSSVITLESLTGPRL